MVMNIYQIILFIIINIRLLYIQYEIDQNRLKIVYNKNGNLGNFIYCDI